MDAPAPTSSSVLAQRQDGLDPLHVTGPQAVWMPPDQMRRYQWNKVIGGLLVSVIFIGWLTLQWSNPAMRTLAITLIAVTGWVVIRSMLDDVRRGRGRQITITDGVLHVTSPTGASQFRLADVALAQWRQDNQPGLWFYDQHRQPLAHLDTVFLDDQVQARNFLGWARQHADLPFEVRWPKTLD